MNDLSLIILAAGKGTRFKSALPKVLHPLAGRPLIQYVLEAADPLEPAGICLIIGHQSEQIRQALSSLELEFVLQEPQLGTGHALQVSREFWEKRAGNLLILYGDVPLISTQTLRKLVETHVANRCSATLLSTVLADATGYGRIIRDSGGSVTSIVEHRDADPQQRQIREINTGIYCFEIASLRNVIDRLTTANSQGEFYLTDCISLLHRDSKRVEAIVCADPAEVAGVNSRSELSELEQIVRARKLQDLMQNGVTVIDPASTFVDPSVQVGCDTTIYPNVYLQKDSVIGESCQIFPNVRIVNSILENGVVVLDSCLISETHIRAGSQVGPFAHLKNHTVIGENCRIGNFVEIKKSVLGNETKAAHLSYLGDAEIGKRVNIGAGTITCNYDGVEKNKTIIDDNVFVGSDSQLIAPLRVHRGAYIAAGSTIQQDVPEDALAIARAHQVNKADWAKKKRSTKAKE